MQNFSHHFIVLAIVVTILVSTLLLLLSLPILKNVQLKGYEKKMAFSKTNRKQNKTPLKFTKRVKRLLTLTFFISVSISLTLIFAISFIPYALSLVIPLVILPLRRPIVFLSVFMISPLEQQINRKFIKQAKRKLDENTKLIKVGITGSVGKTTTKTILASILSERYNVLFSPDSFNTPMGIARTINENLTNETEILIAEMGARRIGEIKELCDIVSPHFGILTAIEKQHIETFKTLNEIKNTKLELPISLPKNGFCVFDKDNGFFDEEKSCASCEKVFVSFSDQSTYAHVKNLKHSQKGLAFTIVFADKSELKVSSPLLGLHNAKNILLAASFAKRIGLSNEEIVSGLKKVKPVPHRLELLKTPHFLIIDNSYNSSPVSSRMSLSVLESFRNGRKIVVTPGLVELGNEQYKENELFGKNIGEIADYCLIVGNENKPALTCGLKKSKMIDTNIYHVSNLDDAKSILKKITQKGDVILFENDLPDNYN